VNTKLHWSHGRLNSATKFIKPKKNNKYFWVFKFKNKNRRKQQTKQIIFGFFEYQTKNKKQSKPKQTKTTKLKRQVKRNNGNIFGLFVFWKTEIKTRSNKEKESETWIYKELTKNDMKMSESSVYLPPSLGFWPKWRSIPARPTRP
jgi:hypothetical protein